MPTFALISEGITDQIVIEKLIRLAYKGVDFEDGFDINHLQPTRDATDVARQEEDDFGGWQQVFEHCSIAANLYEALSLNDYVVIHVDSDICWHESISIDPAQNFLDLVVEVESLIISKIDPQILSSCQDRIIIAVAVHSTECWLLPFFTRTQSERTRINSCEGLLRSIVHRGGERYSKDGPGYFDLVRSIRKYKDVEAAAKCSPSLARFLSSLPLLS
ncbi:hypothetical protein V3D52_24035 [Pseudomonas putida]|uniref:hypothetical protein n=1 Tax=Pseudomonas putida TaxID=303 RepID=UPI0030CB810E